MTRRLNNTGSSLPRKRAALALALALLSGCFGVTFGAATPGKTETVYRWRLLGVDRDTPLLCEHGVSYAKTRLEAGWPALVGGALAWGGCALVGYDDPETMNFAGCYLLATGAWSAVVQRWRVEYQCVVPR